MESVYRGDGALRFEHVVRCYGSHAALDGLDLRVAEGETVALLGPNGAGKTTAISLLLGLLGPDAGTVAVLGTNPRSAMGAGRVAATLQQQSGTGLPPGVRVDRALHMVASLYPHPLDVDEVTAMAGIGPLLGRQTHQLSGGQAQQVRFAMAIAGDPDLLFLDEPTSAMDIHARQVFWRMVRRFGHRDHTVVFATHHLDEADNADRVVVLHHGRVVADGPGATLKAAAATRQLRFVCAAPDPRVLDRLAGATDVTLSGTGVVIDSLDADATVRDLVRTGVEFRHLEVRAARLEEAFLALTQAPRAPAGGPAAKGSPPADPAADQDPDPGVPTPTAPGPGSTAADPMAADPVPTAPGPGPGPPAPDVPAGRATGGRPSGRVATYARFELGRVLRSWKFLLVTVGFPVVFYLLFLGNHAADHPVDGGVPWRLYLMVAMCSFGAMVAGLNASGGRLSVERANGWARQLRVTPLPTWSYLATKVAVGMVVALPVVVLVEVLGAAAGGVRLDGGTWVGLTLLLWALSLPFAVLGVLVGFAVHPETVYPTITALMFVLGYFGGLFTPVDALPVALRTIAHGLPSFQQVTLGIDLASGHSLASGGWLVVVLFVVVPWGLVLWRHRAEEQRGVA